MRPSTTPSRWKASSAAAIGGERSKEECPLSTVQVTPADVPDYVMDNLAYALLEAVDRFYRDPENVRRYEEWEARKAAEAST